MKIFLAEFIGTFTLVFLGCGSAVVAGSQVGYLGIAFAFGFALIAMAYSIGLISGCHINPAVSLGVFTAGRLKLNDLFTYLLAQFLGGIAGSGALFLIVSGHLNGEKLGEYALGANGWGIDYPAGQYSLLSALIFEFLATLLFIIVILGITEDSLGVPVELAGLAIGITLVAIHIFGIPITGVSVNPARSLAPALLVGGKALSQVWLFLLVPSVAGILAGLLYRVTILGTEPEEE